jgi:hypothetical protein
MSPMNATRIVAAVSCALAATPAFAFRAGPPPGRTGSPQSAGSSCRACHGNAVGSGSVQILGAPAQYLPNQIYTLTVRIADPVQAGAGFQLSVENSLGHIGTLILSDPTNTRFATTTPQSNVWAEHTGTGVANAVAGWAGMGNAAEYQVQWRAPATDSGAITFYAAGNAINNNLLNSGDIIYLTSVTATALACPADLNGDGTVNSGDLAALLGAWGAAGPADLNNDGAVNSADLSQLLGSWGPCA